jgi:hypothetical protein
VLRLAAVARVGVAEVEGQAGPAAAALPGPDPVALVGQEVLAGGQQEGPELPLLGIERPEEVLLQEAGEELLRLSWARSAGWPWWRMNA